MTELQIPLAPEVFWPMILATALLIIVALAYSQMSERAPKTPWLTQLQDSLGFEHIDRGLFAAGLLLYLFIFLSLFLGLATLIWQTITWSLESLVQTKQDGELGLSQQFLFYVLRIAGLTTVLAAVVAFPVTLQRLRLTANQNKTAEDALFNEKINAATELLYARRQYTHMDDDDAPVQDVWHDDITRRNAAIDRLGRLALERPSFAPDIARMLSVYVRELSRENPAEPQPDTQDLSELTDWAENLQVKRTDMENARKQASICVMRKSICAARTCKALILATYALTTLILRTRIYKAHLFYLQA